MCCWAGGTFRQILPHLSRWSCNPPHCQSCIGEACWVAGPAVSARRSTPPVSMRPPPRPPAAGLRFICRWQTGIGGGAGSAPLPGHPPPRLRQRARDAPYQQTHVDTILCECSLSVFFIQTFVTGTDLEGFRIFRGFKLPELMRITHYKLHTHISYTYIHIR